jgi:hypothetical protein
MSPLSIALATGGTPHVLSCPNWPTHGGSAEAVSQLDLSRHLGDCELLTVCQWLVDLMSCCRPPARPLPQLRYTWCGSPLRFSQQYHFGPCESATSGQCISSIRVGGCGSRLNALDPLSRTHPVRFGSLPLSPSSFSPLYVLSFLLSLSLSNYS